MSIIADISYNVYSTDKKIHLEQLYKSLDSVGPLRVERMDWGGRKYLMGWYTNIYQFKKWVQEDRKRKKRYEYEYYVYKIKAGTYLNEDSLNILPCIHLTLKRVYKAPEK